MADLRLVDTQAQAPEVPPSEATLLRGRTIVEMLREKLAEAEAGQLTGVVMVYETIDQKIGHSFAARQGVSSSALVGELHLAMMTLHIEDGRLKPPT